MIEKEGYFSIEKSNVDIVLQNNTKIARYYIDCFDRELVILFNGFDLTDDDIVRIQDHLDDSYLNWCDDDKGYCCEEYLIKNIYDCYKNNILAIIYIENEENDENE